MTQAPPNLFRRQDTFFGTFEGLGQDFGINPLWLRLTFVAPLFFFPFQTIAAYLGISVVVFATRWIFPDRAVADMTETRIGDATETVAEKSPARPVDRDTEMALAA